MKAITFNKQFVGHGHYKLNVEIEGESFSHTTSNIPLIDKINSEDVEESIEATQEAIEMVLLRNDLNYKVKKEFSNHFQMYVFYAE